MKTAIPILLLCCALFVPALAFDPFDASLNTKLQKARSTKEDASSKTQCYADGRIFVKFKPSASTARVNRINAGVVASVKKTFRLSGSSLVRLPHDMTVEQALLYYRNFPDVEYAEPCYQKKLFRSSQSSPIHPNDPLLAEQWFHLNTGQTGKGTYYDPAITGVAGADIGSTFAWSRGTSSTEVVIAYIDTGADFLHPDLNGNFWTNPGEIPDNAIDDDGNGYVDDVHGWDFAGTILGGNGEIIAPDNDPTDEDGHGTFGAGLVTAIGNNAFGGCGVLWNARVMVLKVADRLGNLSDEAIMEAYDYAVQNGALVMNASFGGYDFLQTEYDALSTANAAGVLLVASAGNDNLNSDRLPGYPANYDLPNIIAVAATDRRDTLADFSNFGRASVDLAAPGLGILSTLPNYDPNPYYNNNTADYADPFYDLDLNGHPDYGYLAGTSFSAPLVSVAVAFGKGQMPWLGHLNLKQQIVNSAERVSDLSPSSVVSGGRLDLENAVCRSLYLQRVEPSRVLARDGSDTLHLYGTGFASGMSVAVSGTGVTVQDVRVNNPFESLVHISISKDAERSRRDISVVSSDGLSSYTAREILYVHGDPLTLTDNANVLIPDSNFTGVTRTLVVNDNLRIDDILLSIGIDHTWLGDLVIRLQSPAGNSVYLLALAGDGGDSSDDLYTTFPLELRPVDSFDAFKGTNAKGTWTLKVMDVLSQDVGTLRFWKLMIFDDTISSFDFASGAHGWQASQAISPFGFPTHRTTALGISLAAPNNTNTFGFWQSPPDVLPVLADMLYRADFTISTDVTSKAAVPGVRVRAFSQDQQLSYALHLDSSGDGFFSPTPTGATYSLYFAPPADIASSVESEDDFNLAFDILNFAPDDAAHGELTLESVAVERIPIATLPSPTLLSSFDFQTGEEGWTAVSDSPIFSAPLFGHEPSALTLTTTNNTNTFGGWTSPQILALDQKNLYRVRYTVHTDVTAPARVPQVRLRAHEDALQIASTLTMTSVGRANVVPSPYPTNYDVYFSLPYAAASRYILAAMDVLGFDPGDASAGTVLLDSVTVAKIPKP